MTTITNRPYIPATIDGLPVQIDQTPTEWQTGDGPHKRTYLTPTPITIQGLPPNWDPTTGTPTVLRIYGTTYNLHNAIALTKNGYTLLTYTEATKGPTTTDKNQ